MNEFLEQFLVESRELIEQATDDLLALEETPGAADRLDSAFRSFHTLKGAAGIMEFEPMARALHAAEDTLAAARAGDERVTPALVSDCLTCLDQVLQWLDAWEGSGAAPEAADAEAEALVRRFDRQANAPDAQPPERASGRPRWVEELLARRPQPAQRAGVAVRCTPAGDSFFRGLDPLAAFAAAQGLLALDVRPLEQWPPLQGFDAFAAQLVIEALLEGPDPGLRDSLGDSAEWSDLQTGPAPTGLWPAESAQLLQAQAGMLRATGEDGRAGRIASAAQVVGHVLRAAERADEAQAFERLARASSDAARLAGAVEALLAGGRVEAEPTVAGAEEAAALPEAAARSLRVDVERIDALVNLTGEFTVAKNALAHATALAAAGGDAGALASLLRRQQAELERLVRELQHVTLNMRVLPMRHVFQRFPRLMREMVVTLGKPARLVTEGDATEADKTVVEALFEPLLHVLRNALDHGVEDVAAREAAGKPPSATIQLRATSRGDQVIVEVEDDGAGVDLERVRATAVARGIATPEALAEMSEAELTGLIFAPGFSTAATVTSVSGRGVGMDAVRAGVERIGGRVEVESTRGLGTRVRFVLPFTVMMSRVMTVEAGGQLFGIPMDAIVETVRLPIERLRPVGTTRAFVLRERTVPVIDLAEALGGGRPGVAAPELAHIVVASVAGQIGGILVDRLGEPLDVMLKPLDGLLAGARGVSGTTLLGDGRVLLVLDLAELLG